MATKRKKAKAKWTRAEIKKKIEIIQEEVEKQKRRVKKGENFIAVTPEDIERKLKRVNSPMVLSHRWSHKTPPGGTLDYDLHIFNPDPRWTHNVFAHVWVGSGNIDTTVGTFLLNVDQRFPRMTQPDDGQSLAPNTSSVLKFNFEVPSTVEKSNYLLNSCLMQFNYFDVGTYLDRGLIVFEVS
jgi:hypothetical protein